MTPLVAIIGRPNVGKSALFNRLIGKKHAIVSEVYGTTRDILSGSIVLKKREVDVVDTAGLMSQFDEKDPLEKPVQEQARLALQEADLLLFLVDGTVPLTRDDQDLIRSLRKSNKPLILVVTKCDTDQIQSQTYEIYSLGIKDPVFISSLHNRGVIDLLDRMHQELKELGFYKRMKQEPKNNAALSFCIVGKPNVGKSSLFNALLKDKKAVVSDVPGTTRDTLDSEIQYQDKVFQIIDTAGLRRPGKVEEGIEKFSVLRTMRAIKRSDVSLLVIDATDPISKMDQAVSRYILDEKKGLIILVNKWDLVKKVDSKQSRVKSLQSKNSQKTSSLPTPNSKLHTSAPDMMDRFLIYLQDRFDYLPWAPVLFLSAKTGQNVSVILDQVYAVFQERQKRIETGKLNRFVAEVIADRVPSGTKKINPKIYYSTQVEVNPPHFLLFVNQKESFHFSWMRYFENRLREKFNFSGTPVIIELRNREREDRGWKKK